MLSAKGQLSIEYLIIIAAFLSALLAVSPFINTTLYLAEFAQDVQNAKLFCNEISAAIEKISLLSDGSEFGISSRIIEEWNISVLDGKVKITVESKKLEKTKSVEAAVSKQLQFVEKFPSGDVKLHITKTNGKISITAG